MCRKKALLADYRCLRYEIFTWLGRYPAIFLPVIRALIRTGLHEGQCVGPGTELIIEGFPRCGNTFALVAFELSQARPFSIASHVHAPAQVIYGARQGIPTLVLIRPPKDAVPSDVIRSPHRSIRQSLRNYIRFYNTIKGYQSYFVVAEFNEITSDFGSIIARVNMRFGTNFASFAHTAENVRKCFKIIDELDRVDYSRSEVSEDSVSRPSKERRAKKQRILEEIEACGLSDLLAEANALYLEFVER